MDTRTSTRTARRLRWQAIGAAVLGASILVPATAAAQEEKEPFEFHGYMRSGFGVNERLGDQNAFQAPGAYAKYRLGNEAETYIELTLQNNWISGEGGGPWFLTRVTPALITGNNSTFTEISPFALREAYAEAGNIFESQPGMSFWAGHRFYRRHDVHINDFFYWDMSGPGAGFQDMDLGFGKLAVAWLGGSDDNILLEQGRFAKNNFDIRVYDVDAGVGTISVGVNPVLALGGDEDAGEQPSTHGVAATVMHTMGGFMGGFNKLSIQFGYGGAATLNTFIGGAAEGWMLRVVEQAQIQTSEAFSMMWTGSFQIDNTDGTDGGNMWISAGARPTFHLGEYTALLVEAGVDGVQPDGGDFGFLGKLTVAPAIKAGNSFWGRPEIRAFATAAFWNDAIQSTADNPNGVGGAAYIDKTFGLTFGVQAESWW